MKKLDTELAIRRSHRIVEYEATYATKIAKYRMLSILALHSRESTLAEGAELDREAWLKEYIYGDLKRRDIDAADLLDRELEDILRTTIECIKVRK